MVEALEYRRRARQCLELARLAVNAEVKAKIVDAAAIWMRFAERAERTPVFQQQQQIQPKQESS
jgi:Holliday junction resolvase-like predicted endonuclease